MVKRITRGGSIQFPHLHFNQRFRTVLNHLANGPSTTILSLRCADVGIPPVGRDLGGQFQQARLAILLQELSHRLLITILQHLEKRGGILDIAMSNELCGPFEEDNVLGTMESGPINFIEPTKQAALKFNAACFENGVRATSLLRRTVRTTR